MGNLSLCSQLGELFRPRFFHFLTLCRSCQRRDASGRGMGAGKGHTLRNMLRSRRIRLPANTVWYGTLFASFRSMSPHKPPNLTGSTPTHYRDYSPSDLSISRTRQKLPRPCSTRKRPSCKRYVPPSQRSGNGVSSLTEA